MKQKVLMLRRQTSRSRYISWSVGCTQIPNWSSWSTCTDLIAWLLHFSYFLFNSYIFSIFIWSLIFIFHHYSSLGTTSSFQPGSVNNWQILLSVYPQNYIRPELIQPCCACFYDFQLSLVWFDSVELGQLQFQLVIL